MGFDVEPDERRRQLAERLEILEAVAIGVERRAELLDVVASAPDLEAATTRLADAFGLNRTQATVILDLQVRRFSEDQRAHVEEEVGRLRDTLRQLNEW